MTKINACRSLTFTLMIVLLLANNFLFAQVIYKKLETEKYSIELPSTWKNEANYMFFQLMSLAPGDTCCGDFREFITVSSDGVQKNNLEDFFATEKKYIKEGAKDMHQLKVMGEGNIMVNNLKVYWFTYSFNYKGYFWYGRDYYTGADINEINYKEYNLIEKDYFFYSNGRGYLLRCTSRDSNFKQYEPIFDYVSKSVKFK